VFGTVPDARRIPFAITGRAATQASGPAQTLVELLALAGSRVTATALFALLQIPAVAARFGLEEDAVDQLHQWLDAAGFRWGLDAAHRGSFGVPAQPYHTLSDALDRLFLGYAMPDGSTAPFGDRVPIGGAEGTAALALGALAQFAERLRCLQRDLSSPQPPQQWAAICNRALDDFVTVGAGGQAALRAVRQAIATVTKTLHDAAFDASLPFAVYRSALADALDPAAPGGIPTGAVTFASMRALRGVPFKVVCCLGLDDGAYPSPARPAEFDLMALAPRFGDRLRRDDDRNGLLDLLLAARSIVHLSHSGRSIRDNAPLPPSVLVAELIDTVTAAIDDESATARARLVVTHPLQSFSPSIFRADGGGDPRRRSHDRELAQALAASAASAARAAASQGAAETLGNGNPADTAETRPDDSTGDGSVPAQPGDRSAALAPATETTDETAEVEEGDDPRMLPLFVAAPLPLADDTRRDVSVEELSEFFRKPARYFVRRRLGIDLGSEGAELVDDEAFLPDWSGRTALAQRLLPDCLEGLSGEALRRRALAGNEWPSGAIGAATIARELATLERFAAEIRRHAKTPALASHLAEVMVEVEDETWRVHGQFDDLRAGGLVRWHYDEVRAADLLEVWISHLLLAASGGRVHATRWILREECLLLRPPADARALLADLVAVYRDGLREPSPFHPKAAWTLVGLEEKLTSVRGRWLPLPHRPYAEGNDAAVRLVGRGRLQDLEPTFEDVARRVFEPLIAHRDVVALGGDEVHGPDAGRSVGTGGVVDAGRAVGTARQR
jgi:exodeoxyribonuclease V gamma subunit